MLRWVTSLLATAAVTAFLWLWSSMPYLDSWYRAKAQPSAVDRLCFQIYPIDWSLLVLGPLLFVCLYRGLSLRHQTRAKIFLIGTLSVGALVMFSLGGLWLRGFLSVPALDWTPTAASPLTVSFNVVLVGLGCFAVSMKRTGEDELRQP